MQKKNMDRAPVASFEGAVQVFANVHRDRMPTDFERQARALLKCAQEGPFEPKPMGFYEAAYWRRVTDELKQHVLSDDKSFTELARLEFVRVLNHYLGWAQVIDVLVDRAPLSFWIELPKKK